MSANEDDPVTTPPSEGDGHSWPATAPTTPSLGHGPLPELPGYQLEVLLGRGGMGEVYRGRDPELRRDLAIKVMRPECQADEDLRRRFIAEAQIGGQLQHPNVLPVYELGQLPDGRPYFTMKLIKGGKSLARLLRDRGMPAADVGHYLDVFKQVCRGIAHAHGRRVIHRDLKPDNVMVGDFGEVQVIDWGLAKKLAADGDSEGPSEGVVPTTVIETVRSEGGAMPQTGAAGTFAYAAPEQARGETAAVDERADVFGLGAILCEILTGLPPFAAEDAWQVRGLAQMGDLSRAYGRLDECGAEAALVALCKECLAKEKERRPRNAGALAERVAAYQDELQRRVRQAELEQAAAQAREQEARATAEADRRAATAERKRRRLTVALAVGVMLVVGMGGAASWWLHDQRRESEGKVGQQMSEAKEQLRRARSGEPDKLGEALQAAQAAKERARMTWTSEGVRREAEELVKEVEEEQRLARLEEKKREEATAREKQLAERDRILLARVSEVSWPLEIPDLRLDPNGRPRVKLSVFPPDDRTKGKPSSSKQIAGLGQGELLEGVSRPDPDEEFARAFRDWGLDVESDKGSLAEVVASIEKRPKQVRLGIAAALEERAFERRRKGDPAARWQRLLDLAERLDESGDEQTKKLRLILRNDRLRAERVAGVVSFALLPLGAAWAGVVPGEDRNELRGMVRTPKQIVQVARGPVVRTLTLARALQLAGDDDLAFQILRAACHEHPREAVLYQTLGNLSAAQSPPQWADAAVYYLAARALRPELGVSLAHALRESGQVAEGLGLLRGLAEKSLDNLWLSWTCGVAHDFAPRPHTDFVEAVRWYRTAAERGHAPSQNSLGLMFHWGRGVAQDDQEAVSWYRKAAEQGHDWGQYNLGVMYANGLGVARDGREAIVWYRKAAEQGNVWSEYNLGWMHEIGHGIARDYKVAIEWYRKAADHGDSRAQNNLGWMHQNGWGVTKDEAEAVRWYRKAAEQGNATAQDNLARAYADGRGVARDDRQAVGWFRKSAEQGYANGQNGLGEMYHWGLGVAQNDQEAVSWYRKAAEQGYDRGQYNLGVTYQYGRGVARDRKEAIRWYRKAAEQGHPESEFNLGWMHEQGHGVARDYKAAIEWYRKAADHGDSRAQNNLGWMYQNGLGVPGDDKEAVRWYRKAAEQGNATAQNNLGLATLDGRGTPQDVQKAIDWFRKATQLEHVEAPLNLVVALEMGGQLPEATEAWARTLLDEPRNHPIRIAHAMALTVQARFAEGRMASRACLRAVPVGHPLRTRTVALHKESERLFALDRKLTDVLAGKSKPADAEETLEIASLCLRFKKRYATATRFYAAAFDADPRQATEHRYDAAWGAVFAAEGKGEDTRPDARERGRLRRQALDWLQADLAGLAAQLKSKSAANRGEARRVLRSWQQHHALESVRDRDALERLPEAERPAWRKLWADVAALLETPDGPKSK